MIQLKGLYIHIPFCESICHYCDFAKRVTNDNKVIDNYLDALINEIASYQKHFKTIETIYIGGGTPSMLSPLQLKLLFESIKEIRAKEFTIEVNPESYNRQKGELFKQFGVTRISLGVQTFNDNLLRYINRKHTQRQVFDVVDSLKKIGLKNISIDLIYAIPGQTSADLLKDLDYVKQLDIEHVSYYSLILEKKTYFYHQYKKGKFEPIEQDLEAEMFQLTIDNLVNQGFEHYEISNFAKNKKYSLHNLIYWTLGEYIGVGLGAHGFIDGYRTLNQHTFKQYLSSPLKEKHHQNKDMLLQDELIFGLRKIKGVSLNDVEQKYKVNLFDKYPQLKEQIEYGLLKIERGRLMLTKKGIFLGNQVFIIFV